MEDKYNLNVFEIMKTSTPSGRHGEEGEPGGDTIRKLILENWDNYGKINIYFEGVMKMTRPFVDEAFAKVLETRSLEEFNQKLYFPDANDRIVKELNDALKIRLKIIKVARDRENTVGGA